MKKWLFLIGAISTLASATTAYADTTTSINTGSNVQLPDTGDTMYQLQESAYQTSGVDVPHDYIWVNVNGVSVLALDPIKPTVN